MDARDLGRRSAEFADANQAKGISRYALVSRIPRASLKIAALSSGRENVTHREDGLPANHYNGQFRADGK